MKLLTNESPVIKFEAFHVFKCFGMCAALDIEKIAYLAHTTDKSSSLEISGA